MIRADGSQCWVQLSVTLCHSRTMAPHLIAVFADLTERKQAEAELLQLQQGLERQVRERTRELSSTVEQLHREMQERGAMQQRLWQEQRRLQHMLEHTSNAFLELDEALVITGWNPASTTPAWLAPRRDAGAYPARPARQRSPPGPADPSPECCAPSGVRDRHPMAGASRWR